MLRYSPVTISREFCRGDDSRLNANKQQDIQVLIQHCPEV